MTPLTLAQQYMDCLFQTNNWERLRAILADDLVFEGPLYRFRAAEDYIKSLQDDPLTDCKYTPIYQFENNASAALVYRFSKPGVNTIMAQTFEIHKAQIKRILLVFDSKNF